MVSQHIHTSHCRTKRFFWSSIFVGALAGIGLSFLLNLFGLAIGVAAFTVVSGAAKLAVGGFIAMLIISIISTFFSGWISGYLASPFTLCKEEGALYGFTTWCLSLILMILLVGPAGHLISSNYHSLSHPTEIIEVSGHTSEAPMSSLQSTQSSSVDNATVNENEKKNLATSLLLLFILFFIGAISSTIGGYFGLRPRVLELEKETPALL